MEVSYNLYTHTHKQAQHWLDCLREMFAKLKMFSRLHLIILNLQLQKWENKNKNVQT